MLPDQISALIPDQQSGRAARRLVKPAHWKQLASNSRLLWGQCRSKGTRYFHTIVDLVRPQYYCNCASRKRPCAHVLALYFMYGDKNEAIRIDSEVPEWALEIGPKMLAHGALPEAESPEQTQARQLARMAKRQKRIGEMQTGLLALEDWMVDLLRQGLARLSEAPDTFWEDQASRLVDAKLGSLAKRVRYMARIVGTPGWHEKMLEEFSQLYLLIRGFEKLDSLPGNVQYELLAQAGLALRKEDVLEEPGIAGSWLVAGIVTGNEEDLRFRRTWLYELETARFGLLLDFAFGDQPFAGDWEIGQAYGAEAHYYPAAYPQRVLLDKTQSLTFEWPEWQAFERWNALYAHTAQIMGQDPWIVRIPVVLRGIPVYQAEDQWVFVDADQKFVSLEGHSDSLWVSMSLSAGNPITILAEWDGKRCQLVSVMEAGRVLGL
ncbi:MAG: hypothetical protein KDC34_18685 [Saprospiraceae bacterium]|nr:hypothetical protein [Saprospiraceae bacterium]